MHCKVSRLELKLANLRHKYGIGRGLCGISLRVGESQRRFFIRPHGAGDIGVFHQVFVNRDYSIDSFPLHTALDAKYQEIVNDGKTPFILDAGANIGASVVWFSCAYPASQVLAVEPEKRNCELLRMNCDGLRYSLLEAGIAANDGTLFLDDPGIGDWGFRLSDKGDYEVRVLAAQNLIDGSAKDGKVPLIAKIDIEGGEEALFSARTEWVERFPLVIIELHDWLFPGKATSRNFIREMSRLDIDIVYRNENIFCFNNALLGPIRSPRWPGIG